MYYHTIRTVHRFPVVFVHNTVTHKEDTTKYRRRSFLDLYQKNGHVMLLLILLLCHPVNFPVVFLLISYLSSHSPSLGSRPHIHLLATAAATLEYVCPGFSCPVHSACKEDERKERRRRHRIIIIIAIIIKATLSIHSCCLVCGVGEWIGDWECEGGDGKYCDWSNHVRRRLSSLSSSSSTLGYFLLLLLFLYVSLSSSLDKGWC